MKLLAPVVVLAALLGASPAASAACPAAPTGRVVVAESPEAVVYESTTTAPGTQWSLCSRGSGRVHGPFAGGDEGARYLLAGRYVAQIARGSMPKYGEQSWWASVFDARDAAPVALPGLIAHSSYGAGGLREVELSAAGHLMVHHAEPASGREALWVQSGAARVDVVPPDAGETVFAAGIDGDLLRWSTLRGGASERRLDPLVPFVPGGCPAPASGARLTRFSGGLALYESNVGRLLTRLRACHVATGRTRAVGTFNARGVERVVTGLGAVAVVTRAERRGRARLRVTAGSFSRPGAIRGWATAWSRSVELVEVAVTPQAAALVVREGERPRLLALTHGGLVRIADTDRDADAGSLTVQRGARGALEARWYVEGRLRTRALR